MKRHTKYIYREIETQLKLKHVQIQVLGTNQKQLDHYKLTSTFYMQNFFKSGIVLLDKLITRLTN